MIDCPMIGPLIVFLLLRKVSGNNRDKLVILFNMSVAVYAGRQRVLNSPALKSAI
jgi:hypothetical protein